MQQSDRKFHVSRAYPKYALLNVRAVRRDLEQNHGRKVATSSIQNVANWVGSIATAKEETWEYALPPLDAPSPPSSLASMGP